MTDSEMREGAMEVCHSRVGAIASSVAEGISHFSLAPYSHFLYNIKHIMWRKDS
jgi:hypothetical protein